MPNSLFIIEFILQDIAATILIILTQKSIVNVAYICNTIKFLIEIFIFSITNLSEK